MRFDMRSPTYGDGTGVPTADLYQAALEMVGWAESRGAVLAIVCEHHGMDDGYLPSPLVLATAMAARTSTLPIMVAVVVLPLYRPVRLAEEMVVLDIISRGRVSYVAAIGYRPEEYELHGVDFHRRGAIAEEHLGVLLAARTGEPFEHEGRALQVTPGPFTRGGPRVAWGGGSVAAARRAGRHGLDFFGQSGDEGLRTAYEAESEAHGHRPGWCMLPPDDMTTALFVADDLDRAWDELGPYLMHDVTSYAALNRDTGHNASLSFVSSADGLRAEDTSHRIVTVAEAVSLVRQGMPLQLHPLIGGLPPDIAWRYLHTVVDEVLPAVSA
jgi:alkanesulfonate monooxygenase SsuD/methylene tetrahydromethanopterin reductase-like flavin-dependent oxidoreductase (luciferase family)